MFVRIGPYPKPRSKRERHEVVRVHRYDTWSLDSTLAKVIAPALSKFMDEWEHHAGYPSCFVDNGEMDAWRRVVSSMWLAFELIANDYEDALNEELFRRVPAHTFFRNPPEGERLCDTQAWADYNAQREAIDNLIQDGLDNFAKYYRSLWN